MIPSRTYEKVPGTSIRAAISRDAHDYFALTGTDLNDLAVLALRMETKFDDANELRDWQNRINLMLSNAMRVT